MYFSQHVNGNQFARMSGLGNRPPSSLSSRSGESGLLTSQNTQFGKQGQANAHQSGPPSPNLHMSLLQHTASLLAMNVNLKKEMDSVRGVLAAQQSHPPSLLKNEVVNHHNELLRDKLTATAGMPFQQTQTFNSNSEQRQVTASGKKSLKPDSYKTVMCQAWLESKICNFGENCRFAHGEQELRPCRIAPKQNNKYKTKLCDKYTTTGLCPYGTRCLFIHPDNGNNAYIRPDKVAEIAAKHADADKNQTAVPSDNEMIQAIQCVESLQSIQSLLSDTPVRGTGIGARLGLRPHPSWPLEPAGFFQDFQKEMMIREILADFARVASPTDELPMDFRRTPSPAPSELMAIKENDYQTPSRVSGYESGEASPAGSSMFGDSQSPLESFGIGGTSPFSCGSSAMSLNGDGFEMYEELLQTPGALKSANDKTYDPFTFALGTDNLAREMCKHLDLW